MKISHLEEEINELKKEKEIGQWSTKDEEDNEQEEEDQKEKTRLTLLQQKDQIVDL